MCGMTDDDAEEDVHVPLSAILRELGDEPAGTLNVGEVMARFGPRAFGAVLFLFGLLNLVPWPPGGTTITGIPLLLIALQIMVGVHTLWLPRQVTERDVDKGLVRQVLKRLLPVLERVEKFSRPRLDFVFGPVGDRVLGLVCALLAVVIALPIFGGNFLPAVAVTLLALSLTVRDGVLALMGYGFVAASVTALILVADVIIDQVQKLTGLF